ncbi:MAG: helix-turn-helix domain-containing protein [Oscillospiraceae bacterium]|nr:helix-turn-helix domain-containing protein [Oscillospiraceae bacterium]
MKKFQFEGKGNVSGDRIRELRLKARLSQAALAAKMQNEGVIAEQDVISRIESGSRLVKEDGLTFSVTLSKWTVYKYINDGVFPAGDK